MSSFICVFVISETGLDYFGARYYGNWVGRFVTPDWAAKATAVPYAEFGDPQSLNLYSYVRNVPTTRFEADGPCPPGNDCGKIQVTATVTEQPKVRATKNGKALDLATVSGTVQYEFKYGSPVLFQ